MDNFSHDTAGPPKTLGFILQRKEAGRGENARPTQRAVACGEGPLICHGAHLFVWFFSETYGSEDMEREGAKCLGRRRVVSARYEEHIIFVVKVMRNTMGIATPGRIRIEASQS